MRPLKIIPNENRRQKHSVRGLVVEHINHTIGHWWWKKTIPSIKVSFPEAEHNKLAEIWKDVNPLAYDPDNWVKIGFDSVQERNQHKIGEVVDVLFSTSNQIDEFFTGAQLFRWEGVRSAYTSPTAS